MPKIKLLKSFDHFLNLERVVKEQAAKQSWFFVDNVPQIDEL